MRVRTFFALLFTLSFAVFLYFQFYPKLIKSAVPSNDTKTETYQQQKLNLPATISIEMSHRDAFIMMASLITSILSFFGFLISTYLSFRGHQREEQLFSIKAKREQLELDKIQEEINAMKLATNTR